MASIGLLVSVRENGVKPDIKFGCAGSVQIAAAISGLALLCSSFGHLPAYLIFRNTLGNLHFAWLLCIVALLGLGQGILYVASIKFVPWNSLASIMVIWAVTSASFAVSAFAIARHWLPNISFKPTSLRGAA
jgi:hypothetical protein